MLFPNSQRGWWLLWLGPLWALMYYTLFRTLITRRNLKTPGRELEDVSAIPGDATTAFAPGAMAGSDSLAARLVAAFGGAANIKSLDACITRLRVELRDVARASPDTLKALGASGVMQVGGGMQAIFGTRSENLKTDMEEYMRSAGGVAVATAAARSAAATAPDVVVTPGHRARAAVLATALGGAGNLLDVEACALTRVRVQLRDPKALDERALEAAGVAGTWRLTDGIVHLIVGEDAAGIAAALSPSGTSLRPPSRGPS